MHLIYLRLAPLGLDILGATGQERRGSECVCMCVCVCARACAPMCVCVCVWEREGADTDTKEFSSLLMTFVLYPYFIPFYCDEMKSLFLGGQSK